MKSGFILAALSASAFSSAVVVFDNTSLWTATSFRSGQSAPALQIQNTNAFAVVLNRVSFSGENTATQNFKFFIANSATPGTIINTVTTSLGPTAAHTVQGVNVNWTLAAGQSYFICAMFDTANVNFDYRTPVGTTQNGLKALVNGNYSGYASPTFAGAAGAEMAWKLEAVPEPATMTALGLGVAALLRRRRKA